MQSKGTLKLIAYLLVALLFLGIAASVEAQREPAKYPPKDLKPVSQVFINGLSDLGNIQVFVTFQCGSKYRADWDIDKGGIWVKLTGVAFAFYGNDGLLTVHAFTADPPSAIHGFTPGIGYERIPDYSLADVDGNIPIEVFEYRSWYRRWQTRPCVDITESLLTIPKYAAAWQWLVEHNQTQSIRYLLEEMGLEPDTGRIPYSAAVPVANLEQAWEGIDSTPYNYQQPITNEGVDFTQYNGGDPFIPFSQASLTNDQIVSSAGPTAGNTPLSSASNLFTGFALIALAFAAILFAVSMISRNRSARLKRAEDARKDLIRKKQKEKRGG